MQKLVTSKQIRDFESELINKIGAEYSLSLMEKAGSGLAEILKNYSEPYLFVCGKGNNGGDGIVAARYLSDSGKRVTVLLTSSETSLSKDSKINLERVKNKISCVTINESDDRKLQDSLNSSSTVVDCILGTGAKNVPDQFLESIIQTINNSNKTIIACDVPTGVDPDTGNINTLAIKAKETVTFAYPKLGLLLYPGKQCVGEIKTVDIGLPEINSNAFLMDDKFVKDNLPQRSEYSNKGSFGKTLLVCGSKKYPGAALLASKAAAAIGSGLTSLASLPEVFNKITPVTPEITHVEFSLDLILEESSKSSVLVIGPGLTTESEITSLVENLITKANIPIVLDADGINAIAGKKEILTKIKKEIIITPHPKEFARLLNISLDEVLNNKVKLVESTASDLGCTIVLKGPATIIATKNGKMYISPFANAALAKGGTGDVLSGFIGGLIAQKLEPTLASCIGVYIHGKTAELVSSDKTVFSLLPQDLITYLPEALKSYI